MIKLKKVLNEFNVNYDLSQDLKSTLFNRLDLEDDDGEIIKKSAGSYIVKIGNIEIEANKPNEWRSHWEFKFENQLYKTYGAGENSQKLIDLIEKRFHNNISILKKRIQDFDYHYQMSDDMRVYNSGRAAEKEIKELYKSLSNNEKEEVLEFWNGNQPATFTTVEKFEELFIGK